MLVVSDDAGVMALTYILGGARTAFGAFGGALSTVDAADLAVIAARGAIQRSGVAVDEIDQTVFGNVVQSSPAAAYFARHVGIAAGVPVAAPALTVNRLCGSGLQAAVSAAQSILLGESDVALVGGAESMSRYPYSMHGARFGAGAGKPELTDMLWATLTDAQAGCSMGQTAENLASEYGISREAQDAFALRSQKLAHSHAAERALEIVPVEVVGKKGVHVVDADEHIRPDTSMQRLGGLKPAFRADGTVTAGNASGINDGAAALVIASERYVKRMGATQPLARLVSYAVVGVEPTRMGIGPAPALRMALQRAALALDDLAFVEVNEAFAAQTLAVVQDLKIDPARVNPMGGAIALGHPVGASGARILLSAAMQLSRSSERYAAVALCIGGGQGIAAVIERC